MKPPRLFLALLWFVAVPGLSAVASGQAEPAAGSSTAQVERLFASSCSECHLPPDPAFATDRAWLSQVKDTA